MRKIHLMNEEKRDATVVLESVKERQGPTTGVPGKTISFKRYLASSENGLHGRLAAQHGDGLVQALLDGDPEIDREVVGRAVDETQTVFLSGQGEVLHASPKVVDVLFGPDGAERERKEAVDVPGNCNEKDPVRWTGRRMPIAEAVTRFAFRRAVQVKHDNGLSYDFLYAMAKDLHDKQEIALLGAGPKGRDPLIFQENGTPYRGFLAGKVDGQKYKLLLLLSNLELRAPGAN